MTQAILPTRLWGGGADDRRFQDDPHGPEMLDAAGRSFSDLYELSNSKLGDGSTQPTRGQPGAHARNFLPVPCYTLTPLACSCAQ